MVLIRKEDFDPEQGTLIVGSRKQSKTDDVTYRTLVLPHEVARPLTEHHARLKKSERMLFPVFAVPSNGPRLLPDDRLRAERAGRMLDRLINGTEYELMNGWHCLRHSFISICVSKGLTWAQIAEWVGHVSRETTRLYTHFNLADSRRRLEGLGMKF